MPRVIIKADTPSEPAEKLVRTLADELISPRESSLPYVVERHVGLTKSRHVWVVWDLWEYFNEEERADMIVQAYAMAEGADAAENISIALGFLPKEAVNFGVVPFVLISNPPKNSGDNDYRETFLREAERTVLGAKAQDLRYPTENQAKEAIARLHLENPAISWTYYDESSL